MSDISTPDLILTELRDLRTDFNENARVTGERLASVEASMTALVGNGQPGRITNIETDVEALKGWKENLVGLWALVAAIGSIVGSGSMWIIEQFHSFHLL